MGADLDARRAPPGGDGEPHRTREKGGKTEEKQNPGPGNQGRGALMGGAALPW
jgi:hypothetical protein